ncbi:hypothetical protein F1728_07920 [Gimesia benthica]|uniref:Uncharacterized protein n=1 Tax=Gimesia benthica TaxID=2608982 RepID=A0A6I6A996_9PLAN|nr:hypothetical protein [Gimesia benthica]QGQ22608.1 hypothetical protein F1728_07920 [Gimesia benthica]
MANLTIEQILNVLFWAFVALVTLVVLIVWGSREAKRKKELRRQEAERIADLPPELQQLHISANQQAQQFEFSFVLFIIICIFTAALIYFLNWGAAS